MNIVITHTDLDGAVSGYLATLAFDTQSLISSNYNEISEKLEMAYYSYGKKTDLVITDLNIKPKDLQYALSHFNSVTIFDHHPSSEAFVPLQDINPKFKIYFNDEVCATTLVQRYMMDQGHEFTDQEKDFFRYVNIYDNWKHEHREFIQARIINDVFWLYGWTYYVDKIRREGFPKIPEGLTSAELKHVKKTFEDIKTAGQTAEWYNTDCGSTIVIIEQEQKVAINHLSDFIDSQTGIYYIMYFAGQYRCSVRVRSDHSDSYNIGADLEKFIKISDKIDTCGGHANAAGTNFKKGVILGEALTEIERFDSYLFNERSEAQCLTG